MEQSSLLMICFSAFLAVFVLLALLSALMRIIIAIFPQKSVDVDTPMYAAIASAVSVTYPGTKITKIEEIK